MEPLNDGIDLDDSLSIPYGSIQLEPDFDVSSISEEPTIDVGDAIDTAIRVETPPEASEPAEEPITRGFGRRRRKDTTTPKKTSPDVDEWLDFFSRIVIRFLTEWYVDYAFRGIDEDIITDTDAVKLVLTEDERDTIARPFAEFAYKNPFMKKHGRQIVAFSDSFESAVILGRFFVRINRVAAKYRPKQPQRPNNVRIFQPREAQDVNFGQGAQNPASTAGPVPDGYPIVNPGGS